MSRFLDAIFGSQFLHNQVVNFRPQKNDFSISRSFGAMFEGVRLGERESENEWIMSGSGDIPRDPITEPENGNGM